MPPSRSLLGLALLAPLVLGGCGGNQAEQQNTIDQASGGTETAEWSYEGAGAPENWGRLNADYAACATGTAQSPINLTQATRTDLPDPQFDYRATPARIENLGHTLQVNYAPGSSMTVGDARYELAQFHFHTPSEHRLDGKEFPAELHMVHRGPNGQLAVVGVTIEAGRENPALAPLLAQLPIRKGETRQASAQFSAEQLLPRERQHFLYPGSLTTPPCTEGVTWMVMDEPIQMSAEQIAALRSTINVSNRPVQPLGSRQLRLDE